MWKFPNWGGGWGGSAAWEFFPHNPVFVLWQRSLWAPIDFLLKSSPSSSPLARKWISWGISESGERNSCQLVSTIVILKSGLNNSLALGNRLPVGPDQHLVLILYTDLLLRCGQLLSQNWAVCTSSWGGLVSNCADGLSNNTAAAKLHCSQTKTSHNTSKPWVSANHKD